MGEFKWAEAEQGVPAGGESAVERRHRQLCEGLALLVDGGSDLYIEVDPIEARPREPTTFRFREGGGSYHDPNYHAWAMPLAEAHRLGLTRLIDEGRRLAQRRILVEALAVVEGEMPSRVHELGKVFERGGGAEARFP